MLYIKNTIKLIKARKYLETYNKNIFLHKNKSFNFFRINCVNKWSCDSIESFSMNLSQEFENLLKENPFNFYNPYLNKIMQKITFNLITKENPKNLENFQKKSNFGIIVIDEYINSSVNSNLTDFFVICFDYIVILIPSSEISLLSSFFSLNEKSVIYPLSDITKTKIQQIKESQNKIINFQFNENNNNLLVTKEIPSFLSKSEPDFSETLPEKKEILKILWKIIQKCISGFFIKIGYLNSKNDRILHYNEYLTHEIKDNHISNDEFIELQLFSKGSLSSLYIVYLIEKEQICLLKMFLKNEEVEKLFKREHDNYLHIKHPLLPRYFGTTEYFSHQCLLIEYLEGKTLDTINFDELQIKDKMKIIFEIIIVICYLHCNDYIYRDLKPNNIIIDENYSAFLIDFDRMIKNLSLLNMQAITSNLNHEYFAPEILNGKSYSDKSDIYSLGKVISFIASQKDLNKPLKHQILLDKCSCLKESDRPNIFQFIDAIYIDFLSLIMNVNEIKSDIHYDSDISTFYLFLIAEYQNEKALNLLASFYMNGAVFWKDSNQDIYYSNNKNACQNVICSEKLEISQDIK